MPRIDHIIAADGIEMKWCGKCQDWIDVANFCKSKTWDGLRSTCQDCLRLERLANRSKKTEYNKKYWQKTMVQQKEKSKQWRSENKEYVATKHKEWRVVNGKEHDKKQWQQRKNDPNYREKYNAYRREYDKMKRKTDPHYKIKSNYMRRLREVVHADSRALHTAELLGCSIEEFKAHLESQFDENMSWENYSNTGWHIDHIVPCAYFDLTRESHQRRCFNWMNMQPMWSTENIIKKDDMTEEGERILELLIEKFPEGTDDEDINEDLIEDLIEEDLDDEYDPDYNSPTDDEFEELFQHNNEKNINNLTIFFINYIVYNVNA